MLRSLHGACLQIHSLYRTKEALAGTLPPGRYCNSHLQLLGLLPRKSRQGMGLDSGSDTAKPVKRAAAQDKDGKGKDKQARVASEPAQGMRQAVKMAVSGC